MNRIRARCKSFLSLLSCLLILFSFSHPLIAQDNDHGPETPRFTVTIHPLARTTIYNRVALLPLSGGDKDIADQLTRSFHSSLLKSKKYSLLPLSASTEWFDNFSGGKKQPSSAENLIIRAGTALKCRGVISGEVILGNRDPAVAATSPFLRVILKMNDAGNGGEVWRLRAVVEKVPDTYRLGSRFIQEVASLAVNRLVAEMVAAGDRFSTQLPQPRIFSFQGNHGGATFYLRPDPVLLFARYCLLRAPGKGEIFTTVASVRNKSRQATILVDNRGGDPGSTFYYTVVGITSSGLASLPVPPLAIPASPGE